MFLNHRESVDRVYEYLSKEGFCVSALHGGFEQKQREAALFLFSNKSNNILVSTDLASRGLDIADVNNIINYHLPDTEDTFIHRIGRTARWNNVGNISLFCHQKKLFLLMLTTHLHSLNVKKQSLQLLNPQWRPYI